MGVKIKEVVTNLSALAAKASGGLDVIIIDAIANKRRLFITAAFLILFILVFLIGIRK